MIFPGLYDSSVFILSCLLTCPGKQIQDCHWSVGLWVVCRSPAVAWGWTGSRRQGEGTVGGEGIQTVMGGRLCWAGGSRPMCGQQGQ